MKLLLCILPLTLLAASSRAQPFTGDLSLTDVLVSPAPAQSRQVVSVDFFVQNLGPGAGQLASYEILVDGVERAFASVSRTFPDVGDVAAFSDSVPMPDVLVPTNVDVEVRITDNQGSFNNSRHVTVTVNPVSEPDIAIDTPAGWSGPLVVSTSSSATQTMTVVPGGQPVFVSFAYQNLGSAFSSPTVRATLVLDGFPVFDGFYPAMSHGDRRRVRDLTDLGVPGPGSHTLELRLDDGDAIQESDESNNSTVLTFRVADSALANLNFTLSPGSQRPLPVYVTSTPGSLSPQTAFSVGDTVYAELSIRNVGQANSTDFDVSILLDNVVVDSFRQPAIAAGSQAIISDRPILTGLQAGGTLTFVLDANHETEEIDETDNEASVTITIGDCSADINQDGFVDFFDYSDFVAAFEAGGPQADFNHDGFVDFFDYSDFVTAFETGGC